MRIIPMILAGACSLLAVPASAQEAAPSLDPATITIPDLSGGRDPDVIRNGWKYFYFWRADTRFEEALADFTECYRFLPVGMTHPGTPMFAPWEDKPAAETYTPVPAYGLVGVAIGAIIAGPLERRARQSRLRRCMEPRGYQRYPLQERRWEVLTDNFSPASIAMQAKAASGSVPDGAALPEDR
ncbi:hypothetical protein P1X14_03815 [Sphingomonas sp. AOB5]|uniref:hypothetical protein n=1 Tax=Sphingomonas sp. AOB5 TaxID=3034017 RepID=UPI0023F89284|nr:hypothetical protein [Sphingomonas sp. AOB5]MDF7774362.1 hypothetical protein [Sphingomonas sp. AOB5]